MKDFKINVSGTAYPCRLTFRALCFYKQFTGRESPYVTDPEDVMVFIAACARAGCRAEGWEFPYTPDELIDSMTIEEGAAAILAFSEAAADGPGEAAEVEKKKK